jgi:hypothetical protein
MGSENRAPTYYMSQVQESLLGQAKSQNIGEKVVKKIWAWSDARCPQRLTSINSNMRRKWKTAKVKNIQQ